MFSWSSLPPPKKILAFSVSVVNKMKQWRTACSLIFYTFPEVFGSFGNIFPATESSRP